MNKEWSDMNKEVQLLLKKESSFSDGINTLLTLRQTLLNEMLSFKDRLSNENFSAMPFPKADGYHCKTVAYSLWHIFRIEDIVLHTLILGNEQVLFSDGFDKRINSPIITTGNELIGEEIAEFSKKLDIGELYNYLKAVINSSEAWLKKLTFGELKNKISAENRGRLISLNVVSESENAAWLVDYWCKKDIRGLIHMPFSRHWIMHTEACERISHSYLLC